LVRRGRHCEVFGRALDQRGNGRRIHQLQKAIAGSLDGADDVDRGRGHLTQTHAVGVADVEKAAGDSLARRTAADEGKAGFGGVKLLGAGALLGHGAQRKARGDEHRQNLGGEEHLEAWIVGVDGGGDGKKNVVLLCGRGVPMKGTFVPSLLTSRARGSRL